MTTYPALPTISTCPDPPSPIAKNGAVNTEKRGGPSIPNMIHSNVPPTGRRVVLEAEVDVLGDTEAEAPVLGEVLVEELVLLHLQALLEDLLGLLAADGHGARDLLVTTDTWADVKMKSDCCTERMKPFAAEIYPSRTTITVPGSDLLSREMLCEENVEMHSRSVG